jgi:hypothetical protein
VIPTLVATNDALDKNRLVQLSAAGVASRHLTTMFRSKAMFHFGRGGISNEF